LQLQASQLISSSSGRPYHAAVAAAASTAENTGDPTVVACAQVITNKLAGEKYVMYTCGSGKPGAVPNVAKSFQGPLVSVSVNDGGAADFMVRGS
jgi:hypothetical protein